MQRFENRAFAKEKGADARPRGEKERPTHVERDAGCDLKGERERLRVRGGNVADDLEGSDRLDVGQGRVARGPLTLREEDKRLGARVARVEEEDGRVLALVQRAC